MDAWDQGFFNHTEMPDGAWLEVRMRDTRRRSVFCMLAMSSSACRAESVRLMMCYLHAGSHTHA